MFISIWGRPGGGQHAGKWPPRSGVYLDELIPHSQRSRPQMIAEHTKRRSLGQNRIPLINRGRTPILLIYDEIYNYLVSSCLLSSIFVPFRHKYLKRQTIFGRLLRFLESEQEAGEGLF